MCPIFSFFYLFLKLEFFSSHIPTSGTDKHYIFMFDNVDEGAIRMNSQHIMDYFGFITRFVKLSLVLNYYLQQSLLLGRIWVGMFLFCHRLSFRVCMDSHTLKVYFYISHLSKDINQGTCIRQCLDTD
jgi:hypothetical protein